MKKTLTIITFKPQMPRKSTESRIRAIFRLSFKRVPTTEESQTSQTEETVPSQTVESVQTVHKSPTSPKSPKPHKSSTFDFPLELVALVLDYLPQHRVYPFLSLSKGINCIATQRLLRQVYILKRGEKPFLDDAVDDLYHWSLLTQDHFVHLMHCYDKWPGTTIIYEPDSFLMPMWQAIKAYVVPPATLVPNSLTVTGPLSKLMPVSALPTLPITHFARFTVTEFVVLRAIRAKIKVDNLSIFGDVRKIDKCIDLSSVRQLSVVSGTDKFASRIFKLAGQFTRLEDLFVAQRQFKRFDFKRFPKTVKRLVMSWHDPQVGDARCFNWSLEYLELTKKTYWQNWPRQVLSTGYDPPIVGVSQGVLPNLKLFVRYGTAYTVQRISDEFSLEGVSWTITG